jgi:hypothetical protein
MKQFLLISLLIAGSQFLFSQDLIVKKNGDEIKSKVTEITDNQVKYKKWENLDGPIYNIPISDVFMVKYENGKKDFFGNNSTPLQSQAKPTPQPIQTVVPHKYKGEIAGGAVMTSIGVPTLGVGMFFLIAGIEYNNTLIYDINGNYMGTGDGGPSIILGSVLMAVGVALTIAGPIELSKGLKHKRAALGQPVTMHLTPISGNFDAGFRAKINQSKLAGISLNF